MVGIVRLQQKRWRETACGIGVGRQEDETAIGLQDAFGFAEEGRVEICWYRLENAPRRIRDDGGEIV